MTFTRIVQGTVTGFDKVECGAAGCTMSELEALQNLDDIPDALPYAESGCGRLIPTDSANCDVHQEVSMTAMTVMELRSMGTDFTRATMKLTNIKVPDNTGLAEALRLDCPGWNVMECGLEEVTNFSTMVILSARQILHFLRI